MDYEKKYNEALNWMRELYPGLHGATKEDAEHYFPELREIEDERIRKRLIEFVSDIAGGWPFEEHRITKKEAITYLEKQKEASKAIEAVEKIDKYIDEHLANAHDMKDSNPDKKYYRGWDDALGKMAGILQDVYSNEKQKDHFRDDTKKVEKQDYSDLTDLERAIHRGFLSAGVENVPVTIIKETANECKRIANENANAEWSEDDESFYDSIMCEVIKEGMHPTPAQANWLKSLPERFNLQPKQEWSDEDEDMLNCCISSIEEAKENRYAYKETDGDTSYDYEIAWLKSLRPVSKESLQPHWNPSKEQMDALKDVAYGTYQNGNGPALRSLYEQLKKLGVKEEPEYYQHFDPNC